MSHVKPPSGILRQLLARIQPANAAPAAASLAFMMLSPAALAQTPADKPTTLPTVKVEDSADPMQVNDGYQGTQTRVGKTLQDPHDIPQAIATVTRQLWKTSRWAACAKRCATSPASPSTPPRAAAPATT